MRGWSILAVLVGAMVLAVPAWASAPSVAQVNAAFRQAEIRDSHGFKSGRAFCQWQPMFNSYKCWLWTPSPSGSTTLGGVQAQVYRSDSVAACAKFSGQVCTAMTGKPSCHYQVTLGAVQRIVNACRAGWQRRL